jgi:hypothetical protein
MFEDFSEKSSHAAHISIEGDSHFGLDENEDSLESLIKPLPRLGQPSLNNLTISRPAPPILSAEQERDLVVAAQAGDRQATTKLMHHHLPWLRWQARKRWVSLTRPTASKSALGLPDDVFQCERAVELDDLVSASVIGLLQAILQWKPPHRLNTIVRRYVHGELSKGAHDWRNLPGIKIEGDLQRFIRSHPNWPAAWIKAEGKFCKLTIEEIEREQEAVLRIGLPTKYSETAVGDDDGEYDMDGGFKASGETQFNIDSPPPPPIYDSVSQWTREASDFDRGERYWPDRMLASRQRRVTFALGWMGRRFYAQWQVGRKSTCSPHKETYPSWTPQAVVRNSSVRHVAPLPVRHRRHRLFGISAIQARL